MKGTPRSSSARFFFLFRQICAFAWQAKPSCFLGAMVLASVQSVIPLAQAWIVKLIFDQLAIGYQSGEGRISHDLGWLITTQIALILLSQAISSVSSLLSGELGRQLSLKAQLSIYAKVNRLAGLAPFENPETYDTIQIGAQGAQMGPNQAVGILTGLISSTITLVSFVGALVIFSPLLAGLVSLAALPELFVQIRMGRQRFGLASEIAPKERRAGYFGYLLTGLPFAKELRLFNLGDTFIEAFRRLSEEINHARRSQQRREIRWQLGLSLLSNIASSLAFVVTVTEAFRGHISLGDVSLYVSAVASVQAGISGLIAGLTHMSESVLFFTRYIDLMNLPQPIAVPETPRKMRSLRSAVELRGVWFRYSARHPWVFKDLSFSLRKDECLALVGLNGAGKTTLAKLLTRMYDPCAGQIFWDGVDIRDFDPADLRRRIGAIFQDFAHLDLSAFENIALADSIGWHGNRLRIEVEQSARKAGVHQVILQLPKGYQTILSRWLTEDGRGTDLSGGEWQKIALARLFMRNADLLILDEPTAALDAQAEYEVYNRFRKLMVGKTSLLISHRFSTVRMADRIIVLESGQIAEAGSHAELIRLGNTYARLYNMQAESYRENF